MIEDASGGQTNATLKADLDPDLADAFNAVAGTDLPAQTVILQLQIVRQLNRVLDCLEVPKMNKTEKVEDDGRAYEG